MLKYRLLTRFCLPLLQQNKVSISSLYITGDKAKENYAVLTPYMDFKNVFDNPKEIEDNIHRRQLEIDFATIARKYGKYCELEEAKRELEARREIVAIELRELTKGKNASPTDVEKLKSEGKDLREQLKQLKEILYPIEGDFVTNFLGLPNDLNRRCPQNDEPAIIYRQGVVRPDDFKGKQNFHLSRTDLIDFKDETRYYLLKEAAQFDLDFTHHCVSYLVEKGHFTQTANPDFARKIIVEANTVEDKYSQVHEDDADGKVNWLYLTGGGAFESFMGYVAKLSVYPSVLPLKFVCSGRQFEVNTRPGHGLFSATQSNVVQTFVATETAQEADDQFESVLNHIVDLYKPLGVHFRIVYSPAKELTLAESLRASIQMFSPHLSDYVEVGRISNFTDFLSKRLLFNTKHGKEVKFLNIVGGTVAHTSRVLACLIENEKALVVPSGGRKSDAFSDFKEMFETR